MQDFDENGANMKKKKKNADMEAEEVCCPYCLEQSEFVSSAEVYGGRNYGMIYLCRPCWAYVGVHKGTTQPLGRLADDELRYWKKRAHSAFDPVWKERFERKNKIDSTYKKGMARGGRYKRLSELMNLSRKECHIGMFGVEQCKTVVKLCNAGKLYKAN